MPKVFSTSIPKSGTHLFERVFFDLGFATQSLPKIGGVPSLDALSKEGRNPNSLYCYGHWRASSDVIDVVRKSAFQVLVIIRDPRDVCLSMAEFIRSGQPAALRAAAPELQKMPLKEVIAQVIVGRRYPTHNMPSVRAFCDGWMQWRECDAVFIRYEDAAQLLSVENNVATLEAFADVERLGIDVDQFVAAAKSRFGQPRGDGGGTFNVGRAGRWLSVFDQELIELWNKSAKGVATSLGYDECPDA